MNSAITPEQIRTRLLSMYAEQITLGGRSFGEVPDNFDLFLEGIVDSFGILEMIGGLEEEYGITLDLSGLDVEQVTVVGPLSRHVAAQIALHGADGLASVPQE
jgi:acyl carrier protein